MSQERQQKTQKRTQAGGKRLQVTKLFRLKTELIKVFSGCKTEFARVSPKSN
jgi:hypothetical protein